MIPPLKGRLAKDKALSVISWELDSMSLGDLFEWRYFEVNLEDMPHEKALSNRGLSQVNQLPLPSKDLM